MKFFLIASLLGMVLVAGCVAQQTTVPPENQTTTPTTPTETWNELRVFSQSRDGTFVNEVLEVNGTRLRLRYQLPSIYPEVATFNMTVFPYDQPNSPIDTFVATQFNTDGIRTIDRGAGVYVIRIVASSVDYIVRAEELVS